jgi:uncharacterized protein YndB with AHSA1/START domain
MSNSRFTYATYIRTTTARLWQALTQAEFTRRFWYDTWQDCEWKPGATWQLVDPSGRVVDAGEVIEIEPQERLVLSWRNEFVPEMRGEGFSRMSYEFEQQADVVKLTLNHTMDQPNSKFIEAISTGWPPILSSLKSLLETGESLEMTRKWPEGI